MKNIHDESRTVFDELLTSEFTPLIELDSANGTTELRDKIITANGGSVTNAPGEIKLSTSATSNGEAILDTAEKGRYQPGLEGIPGIAIRKENLSTNGEWEAGYFDDQNGFWIEERGDGKLYICHRSGGVDSTPVPQEDWNGWDTSLDFTKTKILRYPYECYYGGPLRVEVLDVEDSGYHRIKTLHQIGPKQGKPIMEESKLPIRARVTNGGDSEDNIIYVGGRHYGVRGRYAPNRRETAEIRENQAIDGTLTPMVSFRKKDTYVDKAKSIKISGLSVLSDTNAIVEIHLNPTGLTDGNFDKVTDVPIGETAVESNTVDTSMSSGIIIDRSLASGGSGNRSNLAGIRRLGLDIPDNATIAISLRTIGGATGTASVVFTLEEEW